jgi:hypothetical protein
MASGALLSSNSLTESTPVEEFAEVPAESVKVRKFETEALKRLVLGKPALIQRFVFAWGTTRTSLLAGGTAGTSDLLMHTDDFSLHNIFEWTRHLFSLLVQARGNDRKRIYEILLHQSDPAILLSIALSEYYHYGNEDRLTLLASLLTDIGARALPALRILAQFNLPECELFAEVIAYLRDVSARDRLETLSYLLRNPSIHVRRSLLESLEAFIPQEATPLLQVLSNDKDDDLAEEARARLESLIV